jgi:hypothetical protein
MHEITPDAIVQMLRDLPNIERLWESEKKDLNFVTPLQRTVDRCLRRCGPCTKRRNSCGDTGCEAFGVITGRCQGPLAGGSYQSEALRQTRFPLCP